jgi:hypothetical protein
MLNMHEAEPQQMCVRVTAKNLVDFLVSHWGIEANPEKIKMIEAMRPPIRVKDVQKLVECLVVLS